MTGKIRNPNFEIRNKTENDEIRNPKLEASGFATQDACLPGLAGSLSSGGLSGCRDEILKVRRETSELGHIESVNAIRLRFLRGGKQ